MRAPGPTLQVGLLGRGITASSSPAIHEAEARALGIALSYELFDFDELGLPDDALADTLSQLMKRGFSGVNVTHPFKQSVIPLLDEIEPTAAALGAINCVDFADGRMIGSNTDWIGFAFMLDHDLGQARREVVAQIGCGGAGSATAFALLDTGTRELRIHDICADRVAELAARLEATFPQATVIRCETPELAIRGAQGVVQATPIGMASHPGKPFDPALFTEDQWLAEIIYFPRETEILRAARLRGLAVADGSAMVIGQAAEALLRFTGTEPDRDRMIATFLAAGAATERSAT